MEKILLTIEAKAREIKACLNGKRTLSRNEFRSLTGIDIRFRSYDPGFVDGRVLQPNITKSQGDMYWVMVPYPYRERDLVSAEIYLRWRDDARYPINFSARAYERNAVRPDNIRPGCFPAVIALPEERDVHLTDFEFDGYDLGVTVHMGYEELALFALLPELENACEFLRDAMTGGCRVRSRKVLAEALAWAVLDGESRGITIRRGRNKRSFWVCTTDGWPSNEDRYLESYGIEAEGTIEDRFFVPKLSVWANCWRSDNNYAAKHYCAASCGTSVDLGRIPEADLLSAANFVGDPDDLGPNDKIVWPG